MSGRLRELLSRVITGMDEEFARGNSCWVCRDCGQEFDIPCSSHPNHHPGCTGERCRSECPMQCGPVDEIREWPEEFEAPLAEYRRAIAIETMRECAKAVEGFANDYPADIFPEDRWNALDDAAKTNLAGVIMRVMLPRIAKRLLAETEAK